MAQFDVYENEEPESKGAIPFLLDVQHDLHDRLNTRLVVPLVAATPETRIVGKLCPQFRVGNIPVFMSTPEMAGYPVSGLRTRVTSLADSRQEILEAIDFLLNGF